MKGYKNTFQTFILLQSLLEINIFYSLILSQDCRIELYRKIRNLKPLKYMSFSGFGFVLERLERFQIYLSGAFSNFRR